MPRDDVLSRLKKGTLDAFVLRGIGLGLVFLLHTVVGRLIGPAGYGIFSYTLALVGLLFVMVTFGWLSAITRFVAQYVELRQWGLLKGVLQRSHQITLFNCMGGATLVAGISLIPSLSNEICLSLRFCALLLPMLGLLNLRRMIFQGLNNIRSSIVLEDILLPVLAILGIVTFGVKNALQTLLIYTALTLGVVLLSGVLLRRDLPKEIYKSKTKYRSRDWMLIALPMLFGNISQIILNRTDVLMLGTMLNMQVTGLYSAANRLALLNVIVLTAVNTAAAPMLSAAFHSGRLHHFNIILRKGIFWSGMGALPFFIMILLWPSQLLGIFGKDFTTGTALLRVLGTGQFINALTGPVGKALLMADYQRQYAISLSLAAVINVIGNLIVIPRWGATGAACVTAFTVVLLNVLQLWMLNRSFQNSRSSFKMQPLE